ncbi:MAG: 50S ribosomal protein L15 [Candidatus Hecatellales archaeon ex4484_218]|nr:MAG: 50S ribosomal protein L15 [Candidatus Hecatellales archaeon ex4484_218]
MPHKLRKTRKLRGSRTHGWGQIGQHRKHGMKGGRGKAGGHKHKWTYIVKYEPDYFSRRGFRCPTSRGELKTINLGELDELVDRLVEENKLNMEEGKYVVDLEKLGYEKLLGEGEVSKPLIVKTKFYSKLAEKKIQDVGGQLVKLES